MRKVITMITIILDDGGRITTDEDINTIDVESRVKYGQFMTIKNQDDGTTVDLPASKISRIVRYHTSSERNDERKHDRKLEFPSTGDEDDGPAILNRGINLKFPSTEEEDEGEEDEDMNRSFQDFKKAWEDALRKDDEKDAIIKKPAKGKLD